MHTWAFSSAHATPYLFVKSPQRRSGKTRLLEVLELVCRGAMRAASVSEAGLFQAVEAWRPTFLLDEIDAMFTSRSERAEAVRGILNAGNRPNSFVVRGTQDGTPAKFDTFCPKVLAGIDTGKLPDTIKDRSIVIGLERKLRSESVARLRERELRESLDDLRAQLENWAAEHAEALAAFQITEPIREIDDRLEEAWEPLLAVAEVAGGDWPERGRRAAVALSASDAGAEDRGQLLLCALKAMFTDDAMFTADICSKLNFDDELPFGGDRKGAGIDGRGLAALLKPYGIKPANVRIEDKPQAKGYERTQFAGAWERYADTDPAVDPSQASQRLSGAENGSPKRDSAGTDSRNGSVPHPSQADTGTDAFEGPSQIRPSENGSGKPDPSDWDVGTDGTDEVQGPARAPVFDMPLQRRTGQAGRAGSVRQAAAHRLLAGGRAMSCRTPGYATASSSAPTSGTAWTAGPPSRTGASRARPRPRRSTCPRVSVPRTPPSRPARRSTGCKGSPRATGSACTMGATDERPPGQCPASRATDPRPRGRPATGRAPRP
jgi:hypothetical protein